MGTRGVNYIALAIVPSWGLPTAYCGEEAPLLLAKAEAKRFGLKPGSEVDELLAYKKSLYACRGLA